MSLSFLWASVSLISILISVNSSNCSSSRVEDVCSWALTEPLLRRSRKKKRDIELHICTESGEGCCLRRKTKKSRFFSMKSPKVTHANHHFQWQKRKTLCICGLKGLKKIPVHCNYAYIYL